MRFGNKIRDIHAACVLVVSVGRQSQQELDKGRCYDMIYKYGSNF
jgi:hypothetical protein